MSNYHTIQNYALKNLKLRANKDQNYALKSQNCAENYAEFSQFLTANYRHFCVLRNSNKMFCI